MKKTKMLVALGACLIAGGCLVTGTLAWFTADEAITNTFTVGNIEMILDETKVDGLGKPVVGTDNKPTGERTSEDQTYKIIPGTEVVKDPTVTIDKGSEKCYVFVNIEDGLNKAIPDAATIEIDAKNWEKVNGTSNVYQYVGPKSTLGVVDASVAQVILEDVFETILIDGDKVTKDNIENLANKTVVVNAYAHQSENTTLEAATNAAKAHFNAIVKP